MYCEVINSINRSTDFIRGAEKFFKWKVEFPHAFSIVVRPGELYNHH